VFNVQEELDKREKVADSMIMLAKKRVGVCGPEIVFRDLGKTDYGEGEDDCQGGWSSFLPEYNEPIR
jgi:hypothetical protein